jgi:hypothetical protein
MNRSVKCYTLQFSVVVGHIKVLKIFDYINFKIVLVIKVLKNLITFLKLYKILICGSR